MERCAGAGAGDFEMKGKSRSRFSDLLTAEREPEPESLGAPREPKERKPGRPRGRRSSADYRSVTTFLHADTYRRTRAELAATGGEFGELVDSLLREWLVKRNAIS